MKDCFEHYDITVYNLLDNGLDNALNPYKFDQIKFIQTKQEYANIDNEAEKCEICLQGKKKIMFGCKAHFVCVVCAYKLKVCPFCRSYSEKIKIFN